jgi:hypothetical protein
MTKRINLDDWYNNDQAVKRLSENAGRPIDRNYPRTLARYGKVRTLDIGAGVKLYRRQDIDEYIVSDRPGRKSRKQQEQRKNENDKTTNLHLTKR